MQKLIQILIDNGLSDGPIVVYCTKWNASIGQQIISVCGDNLYITPYVGGIYGVRVKKSVKISKADVQDIGLSKSVWTGNKIIIYLKNGKSLKYKLINNSWLDAASDLVLWANPAVFITTKKMTVREAFLLDCRVTARRLIANGETFTLSHLVHKVVNNDNDSEQWLKTDGENIYLALKEDVKSGELKAKIILVKKGEQIVYEKIRFEVKG